MDTGRKTGPEFGSASSRMLEFFVLIGGGLLLISLPGLAYPALVGWRSRRDAVFALCIAAALLSVALFA